MTYEILQANCLDLLYPHQVPHPINLTFLDPPFNQGKTYSFHDDQLPPEKYWEMMTQVCKKIFDLTTQGGTIYFMQREKNTELVLRCLRETDWTFQNLIIWKKITSAVPNLHKFGKHYQIIAFATKGPKAKTFNRLRINPPLPAHYKLERPQGVYATDLWDDIRELTSGYFAGEEALRNEDHERFHKQQTPLALLLRIILSSTQIGDIVLDPFAGTGTTLVVAHQLQRKAIGIEIDPKNVNCINERLKNLRQSDDIERFYKDYLHTKDLDNIWPRVER